MNPFWARASRLSAYPRFASFRIQKYSSSSWSHMIWPSISLHSAWACRTQYRVPNSLTVSSRLNSKKSCPCSGASESAVFESTSCMVQIMLWKIRRRNRTNVERGQCVPLPHRAHRSPLCDGVHCGPRYNATFPTGMESMATLFTGMPCRIRAFDRASANGGWP